MDESALHGLTPDQRDEVRAVVADLCRTARHADPVEPYRRGAAFVAPD